MKRADNPFEPLARAISPLTFSDMWDKMDVLLDAYTMPRMMMVNPLAMDIKETEKEFLCHIDVPGVKKKDIVIEVENKVLTVIADRAEETTNEEKKGDWIYKKVERFSGRQTRSLAIPDNVDEDSIKSTYHEGVLNIHLPKKIDEMNQFSNKKKIEVN